MLPYETTLGRGGMRGPIERRIKSLDKQVLT